MAEVLVTFKAEADKFKTELNSLKANISSVDDEAVKAGNDTSKSFNKASESVGKTNKEAEKFSKISSGIETQMKAVGAAILAAFTIQGVQALTKEVIRVTGQFQRLEAVLTNTLGSKSEAQKALQQIQDFAASTPFSVGELSEAFVKLANQGFRPTREEMRKLGDLAASTGKSFDQLTEAIIDAQTGEFERLKEFGVRASKEGDKVTFSFKGVETQTKFTATEIRKYLLSLGDLEGVKGSTAAISETLEGKLSNLGDAYDNLLKTIGEAQGQFSLFNNVIDATARTVNGLTLIFDSQVSVVDKLKVAANGLLQVFFNLGAGSYYKNIGKLFGVDLVPQFELTADKINAIVAQFAKMDVETLKQKKTMEAFVKLLMAEGVQRDEIERRYKNLFPLQQQEIKNTKKSKEEIEALEKKRKEAWEKEWKRIKAQNELLEAQKEFEKQIMLEIIKLREDAALKLSEIPFIDENIIEEDVDRLIFEFNRTLDGQLALFEAQRNNLKFEYQQGIIDYEEYQKRLTEINNNEIDLRNQKKLTELQFASEITTSLLNLNELILSNSKAGAEISKQLALFQIGIDTAKAISTITAEMAKGNLTPIEYGLKVASGIAIVTQNMLRAKNLLNQDVPAFAEGTERVTGGVKGKDSVLSLLMPDEAVIKAKENMKHAGLAKAWNAGRLEDYIADKWVLPALVNQQKAYKENENMNLARNIANSIMFNDKNLIRAHKAGMRTQWETTEYLAGVIKKSKRNPYSPLN